MNRLCQLGFLLLVSGSIAPALSQELDTKGEFPSLNQQTDWPWWRGMQRNGIASENASVPVEFSKSQNVKWRAAVPGRGHSSPVVLRNQIFLATADEGKQTQSVLCYALENGERLWEREVSRGGFPAQNHPKNTEASTTIATDGEHVFVTFFHHQHVELISLNLDGSIAWRKAVGPFNPRRYEYGYAPSPVMFKSTIIVVTEQDGDSALTALDRQTGKVVWSTPRPNNISFSSPVVATVAGKAQLLISGGHKVNSYDPNDGQLLWSVDGTTAATCGTMVWTDTMVFASGGYPDSETIAVMADGSGKVAWKNNQKCYEQSMIVVDDYLYALTDKGIMYCWRCADGNEMWRVRLEGPISASPVLVGGNIYWSNEVGSHYVFVPTPDRFELIRDNRLGNDNFASPAVVGGNLLLRIGEKQGDQREEFLYCISQTIP